MIKVEIHTPKKIWLDGLAVRLDCFSLDFTHCSLKQAELFANSVLEILFIERKYYEATFKEDRGVMFIEEGNTFVSFDIRDLTSMDTTESSSIGLVLTLRSASKNMEVRFFFINRELFEIFCKYVSAIVEKKRSMQ